MQIHVLGDSIVTAYGSDENNFIGGWGDHLDSFLKGSTGACLCRRRQEQPEFSKRGQVYELWNIFKG